MPNPLHEFVCVVTNVLVMEEGTVWQVTFGYSIQTDFHFVPMTNI